MLVRLIATFYLFREGFYYVTLASPELMDSLLMKGQNKLHFVLGPLECLDYRPPRSTIFIFY